MKKKETIITAITFIVLIAALATGIFFLVRLVNGPDSPEDGPRSGIMSGELKTYTHPDYGFTFKYPESFNLGNFQEGAGEVILVQLGSSTPKGELNSQAMVGFQIFVSLYEEENTLSKAIIEQSAPDLKIDNFEEISLKSPTLGGEKSDFGEIKALSFDTDSTHEIWFVQDGNLFQFTSYLSFAEQMEEIIKTIRFN